MAEVQLGAKLSDKEEDDIVAFLNSLTGQLPKIEYPILPREPARRHCPLQGNSRLHYCGASYLMKGWRTQSGTSQRPKGRTYDRTVVSFNRGEISQPGPFDMEQTNASLPRRAE